MAVLVGVMSIIAAISGICLGWSARGREKKKEIKAETKAETEATTSLKLDVEYIKRGVDDIRIDVRAQGQKVDELSERVTRVEESAKQAHKRIDEIRGE
jgi:peptidoglycan hydrolase CwlO-like protein